MAKQLLLGVLIFLFTTKLFAGSISGHVYNSFSKEQLVGVTIFLTPSGVHSATLLDGSFVFNHVVAGNITLKASYSGFQILDTTFELGQTQHLSLELYLLPRTLKMEEVVISSHGNTESDEFARRREQTAKSILNIISANAISLSPDITVANVMQRVSGVSVERSNSGDGQYAIIRGMDKRYNTTLVNGIKIPSPDNRNRYVPLDIFPAELLDRLEVVKSLTPDMEADAAGGVINLIMKSAPDSFRLEGNAGTGYSQLFLNREFASFRWRGVHQKSPAEVLGAGVFASVADFPYQNLMVSQQKAPVNKIFNLTTGKRFFHNRIGLLISGSYQNTFRGSNSSTLIQSPTVAPASAIDRPLNPTFSNIAIRAYSSNLKRLGTEAKVDYKINDHQSVSFFATYLQLDERRVRMTIDSLLGGYSYGTYVGSYAVYNRGETRSDLQSIVNGTVQGKHLLPLHILFDWTLAASKASRSLPDIAEFSSAQPINPDLNSGTITVGPAVVGNESRQWIHNTDKDLSGYTNIQYNKKRENFSAIIRIGGMYRHKERDNYDNRYVLSPFTDSASNDEQYHSLPASRFTFIPANAALGNAAANPGIYHFDENVGAIYGQADIFFSRAWEVLAGMRIENTRQQFVTSIPVTVDGKYGSIRYTDYLPSVQVKYSLNDKKDLRFSYFTSIYRPAYADLIPFQDNSTNENYATSGNPHLQHTLIKNLDFRYEWFPTGLDQLMAGAFYKYIQNPIEYALTQNAFTEQILQPNNFGNATNYGVEVVFRKFFRRIGISGNYTYTHSRIQSAKNVYFLDANGSTINTTVNQSRPLQGQSAHIGNLSLLYKDTKSGLEAQLALVYTGVRINTLSLYKDLDTWEKPTTNLDFSAQKAINSHLLVYVKLNNLLNTPYELIIRQHNNSYDGIYRLPFQESSHYVTVQHDLYYATYLIGVRFNF